MLSSFASWNLVLHHKPVFTIFCIIACYTSSHMCVSLCNIYLLFYYLANLSRCSLMEPMIILQSAVISVLYILSADILYILKCHFVDNVTIFPLTNKKTFTMLSHTNNDISYMSCYFRCQIIHLNKLYILFSTCYFTYFWS
jgi:hypothetical protein